MFTIKWRQEYGMGRPMSDVEKCSHNFHENGLWILGRTLIVSCEENPTLSQVNEALKALMKWNPTLRMGIRKLPDGTWEFYEQDKAKPRLECLYNEDNWKKVMEDEMVRPIGDLNAPLFRCMYLPNAKYNAENGNICTFIFTINHCIIDGMSTISLLRRFRLFLNDICLGKEPNIEPWPKMYPPGDYYVERAIEKLPDERRQALKSVTPFCLYDYFNSPCSLIAGKKVLESEKNPTIPFRTCLAMKEFSPEDSQKLRLACRKNNSTIQAASQVAGSMALAKILQDSDEWKDVKINYSVAANMRRLIAPEIPVDYTGIYVAQLNGFSITVEKETTEERSTSSQFWKLTQEATAMIKEKIKKQDYLDGHVAFASAQDLLTLDPLNVKNEGRQEEVLYSTSYGAWDFPVGNGDVIRPLAVFSNSSIYRVGPLFSQQLITVNGKLTWTIGWSQRVVSQETADEFARLMFSIINDAIQD